MTKNKKFLEIQSAALPEIDTAISTGFKKNNLIVDKLPKEQEKERKVEYIHEEIYDAESKQKWTIFNKHALEVCESEEETQQYKFMEDSIIEQMKLDELNTKTHFCNIP